nr:immunoglobulin heavy chain junction region [Macaca mulatta]MOX62670.1 immunoglobulin heavy chain junction region [Macaca mulatta]MOX62812.1 immunoglobulin heavy chain junction region [Macaca mulatta]MOX64410.1 immunoglobulin heavy chain junction region [Macaca mulatta]MOX66038.1 immunoglobulin heavy chain junction region [Macaca mulatta]
CARTTSRGLVFDFW